jgi:hypothetical protein
VRIELPPVRRGGRPVVALCLGVHDLALAKLAAARERDHDFVAELVRQRMVDRHQLELGVELMPESHRAQVGALLAGIFALVDRT